MLSISTRLTAPTERVSERVGRVDRTSPAHVSRGMTALAIALSTHLLACGVVDRDGSIRWGVMGAGKISRDFVGALKALAPEEGEVVAVGARDLEGAAAFARELSVERVHGGYEALAADPEVDVIYVGTVAQVVWVRVRARARSLRLGP